MRNELDTLLVEKYPKIFVNRHADMRTTAMCWGFECDDGWFNIIDLLCFGIQSHIDWSRKQRAANLQFNRILKHAIAGNKDKLVKYYTFGKTNSDFAISQADSDIAHKRFREVPEKVPQVVAEQVKEKFGTLRFYYRGGDSTIDGMVRMAEAMSSRTCEECGNPGKPTPGGWIWTLCETHTRKKSIVA